MSETSPEASRRGDFAQGLADVAPMAIAYAPIAALWGTIAVSKGLSPAETLLMSLGIYSGAAQFVAMDLWHMGLPLLYFVFTLATIGLRHVLMSASVSRHMSGFSRLQSSILLYWLTDEAWALIERRALTRKITPAYFFGASFPLWPTWAGFSLLGALLGKAFGDGKAIGLDFAFAAMFIAVLAGFWKGPRTGAILAVSAAASVAAKLLIGGAWYIVIGGLAGMAIAVLLHAEQE
ncbi:MAG: AzlC family ABC transporter permease [Hyphomicrobiales bacterium]